MTLGIPFGLSVIMPPNLPLPTKIATEILQPVDVVAQFGTEPPAAGVDRMFAR